jgi:hypothetical protein
MADFETVLVARVPASSGPPTLVEVDRLVFDQLSYTDELNRPGSATLGCPISSLSDPVKERLSNLATFPCEVWVYRNSGIAWAGEIQTLSVEDQTVKLNCTGLLGYTWRMGVTTDLTFNDTDQFTIAASLVDHWQDLAYGNYGIDTSAVMTSGVLRDRVYLRDELHNIGQRLQELGAVINGFDMHVDPTTRQLVLSYPQRGIDLTQSVFLDRLNIDSASVALSVAPDDLVSDVAGTGTVEDSAGSNTKLYTMRENATVRAQYGRSWAGVNFDGVSNSTTLEGHTDAYKDVRDDEMFQPGVTLIPREGSDAGDFGPGDTVSYSYDAGIGVQSGTYRVAKVTVDIDRDGKQRLGVEFT